MSHSHSPAETLKMQAQETADPETGYYSERYFVVKTGRDLSVANFQPNLDRYAGGPFLTWAGACTYIEVQSKYRRTRRVLTMLSIAALIALCAVVF